MDFGSVSVVVSNSDSSNIVPFTKKSATDQQKADFHSLLRTFFSFVPDCYREISYKEDEDIFQYQIVLESEIKRFNVTFIWSKDIESSSKSSIYVDSKRYGNIVEAAYAFNAYLKENLK